MQRCILDRGRKEERKERIMKLEELYKAILDMPPFGTENTSQVVSGLNELVRMCSDVTSYVIIPSYTDTYVAALKVELGSGALGDTIGHVPETYVKGLKIYATTKETDGVLCRINDYGVGVGSYPRYIIALPVVYATGPIAEEVAKTEEAETTVDSITISSYSIPEALGKLRMLLKAADKDSTPIKVVVSSGGKVHDMECTTVEANIVSDGLKDLLRSEEVWISMLLVE